MKRIALAIGVGLLLLADALPARAQTTTLSATFSASPRTVVFGDTTLWTLTITNTGSADALQVTGYIGDYDVIGLGYTFGELAPAGWTIDRHCEAACDILFRGNRLAPGASASFSVQAQIALGTPGAILTMTAKAFAGNATIVESTVSVTVAGGGLPPSGASQLFTAGAPVSTGVALAVGSSRPVFDPLNSVFLFASRGQNTTVVPTEGSIDVTVLDANGAFVRSVKTEPTTCPGFLCLALGLPGVAYSADLTGGSGFGGAMVAWFQDGDVIARPFFSPTLTGGVRSVVSTGSVARGLNGVTPLVAYSPRGRLFLVAWNNCPAGATTCAIGGRRVGLDGLPIGPVIDLGTGRATGLVWNPTSEEFDMSFFSAADHAAVGFERVGWDGTVRAREIVDPIGDGSADIDVNTTTGNAVMVWSAGEHSSGAEIGPSGLVISRGLIASTFVPTHLSYNPVSHTFLVIDDRDRIVELNGHGAPLSSLVPFGSVTFFLNRRQVGARPDVAVWLVASLNTQVPSNRRVETQGVGTLTRDGGSTTRLGGCVTDDPFAVNGGGVCYGGGWLPPGIQPVSAPALPSPAPGACTIPDPFTAIGGGTCSNGGWLPPGIAPTTTLPGTTPGPPAPATGCPGSDPFAASGGGTCVNSGWLPKNMTAPVGPAGAPGVCTIPDPFTILGGGLCVNGGWIPRTIR